MGKVFPTHILAWGRYPHFQVYQQQKIVTYNMKQHWNKVFEHVCEYKMGYWIFSCNLWPKHMVMFALHWAGREWNGCSSNLILTPRSQFPGTGSNNPETLPTHNSVLLLTLQKRPRNSSNSSLIPPRMTWDLSPLLPRCKSHRPYTEAVIHKQKHPGWRGPQDISSPARSMVNTEFRPYCLGCHLVASWKPPEVEISWALLTSCSGCIYPCSILWCSFLSVFLQLA